MNTIILTGRLGQDPQGRESKNGGRIASFSIATTRPTKARETDWHNCTVLRPESAAALLEHAHKGDALTVQGSLQYWDGDKSKHNAEIIVNSWEFTPAGGRNERQQEPRPRPSKPRAPNEPGDVAEYGTDDTQNDGFPF